MPETREFRAPVRAAAAGCAPLTPEDFLPRGAPSIDPECVRARLASDLRAAAARFGVRPKDLLLVSGLGGAPDIPALVAGYAARVAPDGVLPFAGGAYRANPSLTIVALVPHTTGAWLGRLIDAAREDVDIVCVALNGGCRQRGASYDSELAGIAGSVGTGFIARLQPGEECCVEVLAAAMQRRGFAFIEAIGACSSCPGSPAAADVPEGRGVLIEKPAVRRSRLDSPLRRGIGLSRSERDRLWDIFR